MLPASGVPAPERKRGRLVRYPPSNRMWGIVACPARRVTSMKLVGLLDAALGDPALATARDLARQANAVALDLTAPAAPRPFVVAVLAAEPGTPRVVRPRHRVNHHC